MHALIVDLGSRNGTWVGSHRLIAGHPYALQIDGHSGPPPAIEFGPSIHLQLSWESAA